MLSPGRNAIPKCSSSDSLFHGRDFDLISTKFEKDDMNDSSNKICKNKNRDAPPQSHQNDDLQELFGCKQLATTAKGSNLIPTPLPNFSLLTPNSIPYSLPNHHRNPNPNTIPTPNITCNPITNPTPI